MPLFVNYTERMQDCSVSKSVSLLSHKAHPHKSPASPDSHSGRLALTDTPLGGRGVELHWSPRQPHRVAWQPHRGNRDYSQ